MHFSAFFFRHLATCLRTRPSGTGRPIAGTLRAGFLALTILGLSPDSLAAGDAVRGKTVFARCAACHQVGPSARGVFGPHLNGVLGRRAGDTPDYAYSDALKKSGIIWNEQTLAAFLKDPGDYIPGTKMRFFGMSDEKRLADLFAYLRQFP